MFINFSTISDCSQKIPILNALEGDIGTLCLRSQGSKHENLRTRGCLPSFPPGYPQFSCSQCTASPRTHTWPASYFLDICQKNGTEEYSGRCFLQKTTSWILIQTQRHLQHVSWLLFSLTTIHPGTAFNLGRGTWGSLMVPAWQSDPTMVTFTPQANRLAQDESLVALSVIILETNLQLYSLQKISLLLLETLWNNFFGDFFLWWLSKRTPGCHPESVQYLGSKSSHTDTLELFHFTCWEVLLPRPLWPVFKCLYGFVFLKRNVKRKFGWNFEIEVHFLDTGWYIPM